MRLFSTSTESAPSLSRSLPWWSLIMNSPPPFWTKARIALFSADVNRTFGSGRTSTSMPVSAADVIEAPGGSVVRA